MTGRQRHWECSSDNLSCHTEIQLPPSMEILRDFKHNKVWCANWKVGEESHFKQLWTYHAHPTLLI